MEALLRRCRVPALAARHCGTRARHGGTAGTTRRLLLSQLFQPLALPVGGQAGPEGRPGEPTCRSQRLMLQGGLIHPTSPGCYCYLPPTVRAMEKLIKVMDQEMQAVGGQKLNLPSLCSAELWRASGRWDQMGPELFRLLDRHNHGYCLGPTHEEVVTALVASQSGLSYRQLPLRLYQITRKFRDEPKPRFGLLRSREFYMKDMYTFDSSEEAARRTYEQVCAAYCSLFTRLGLRFVKELEAIPMFMKRCPAQIDAARQPELACLQSLLFDEERSPAELARMYKNEGNEYFKEKDYGRAVAAYSEGLRRRSGDAELDAVLLTNRAAAHFHLGNYRSALNDAIQAKKLKPTHLKAVIRGALCHMELKNFLEAIAWCEEGLQIDSKEKKLVEIRAKADKLKRIQERDARKAKVMESKEQCQKEILLAAIKERNIKLVLEPSDEEEEVSDGLAEISLDGFHSDSATGAKVHLDADGNLNWPVLFLYPEHEQTDFTVAFHENSRFIDHLMVMFAELPPWDLEKKYHPNNLELYFEDGEREEMYEVNPEHTLLQMLQHKSLSVTAGIHCSFRHS
ncbi:hypothetical protein TURU_077351 [Turdus rufiventris]|nr:hypothetical protein TURU_077351 [Turdus rufiventris]